MFPAPFGDALFAACMHRDVHAVALLTEEEAARQRRPVVRWQRLYRILAGRLKSNDHNAERLARQAEEARDADARAAQTARDAHEELANAINTQMTTSLTYVRANVQREADAAAQRDRDGTQTCATLQASLTALRAVKADLNKRGNDKISTTSNLPRHSVYTPQLIDALRGARAQMDVHIARLSTALDALPPPAPAPAAPPPPPAPTRTREFRGQETAPPARTKGQRKKDQKARKEERERAEAERARKRAISAEQEAGRLRNAERRAWREEQLQVLHEEDPEIGIRARQLFDAKGSWTAEACIRQANEEHAAKKQAEDEARRREEEARLAEALAQQEAEERRHASLAGRGRGGRGAGRGGGRGAGRGAAAPAPPPDVPSHICVVCHEARRTVVFLPCEHCVTCDACTKLLQDADNTCPICRGNIVRLVRPRYP